MQTGLLFLKKVEFFPAFSRNTSPEQEVRNRTVDELLGFRVELESCIELLGNDSQTEHLTERTCNAERRTGLLDSLTGKEEILEVVRRALRNFRKIWGHFLCLALRNDAQRCSV